MSSLNPYEQFWVEWFCLEGREVGDPYRTFCPSSEAFLQFVDRCHAAHAPCYLSVNPYHDRDRVAGLEKLFFDFDCADAPDRAFAEAADFAQQLDTHYRVAPLLVFSGRKGYHVYSDVPKKPAELSRILGAALQCQMGKSHKPPHFGNLLCDFDSYRAGL
jgi:hypothetical protein